MKYEQIVSKARNMLTKYSYNDNAGSFAVEVNVTGPGEGVFYIRVQQDADGVAVDVEPYNYYDYTARVTAPFAALRRMMERTNTADELCADGKMEVEGDMQAVYTLESMFSNYKTMHEAAKAAKPAKPRKPRAAKAAKEKE